MEQLQTLPVGEIVKRNYKTAEVFERFGLDFCCMGEQTLATACANKNIDPQTLISALEEIDYNSSDGVDFGKWPLDLLSDYIYKKHHKYIEEKSPQIKGYLDKICSVHGSRHEELHEVREIFYEVAGELAVHMKKEEFVLFPYIKKMVKSEQNNTVTDSPVFGTVESPINAMKSDHLDEGQKIFKIAALTNNYTPPEDACNTYTVALKLLQEFEKDIHMHIHLENNILFSKAIDLERKLLKASNHE